MPERESKGVLRGGRKFQIFKIVWDLWDSSSEDPTPLVEVRTSARFETNRSPQPPFPLASIALPKMSGLRRRFLASWRQFIKIGMELWVTDPWVLMEFHAARRSSGPNPSAEATEGCQISQLSLGSQNEKQRIYTLH